MYFLKFDLNLQQTPKSCTVHVQVLLIILMVSVVITDTKLFEMVYRPAGVVSGSCYFLIFITAILCCFQMGYANTKQTGAGIHTRLYSRAFIIDDGRQRVVFVTADVGMVSQRLRLEVKKHATFNPT